MTVVTDAEDLEVDAAGFFDPLFVFDAVLFDLFLFPLAVGNMAVGGIDIDLPEELFLHKAVIALKGIVVDGVVFVEVEGDDVFKT